MGRQAHSATRIHPNPLGLKPEPLFQSTAVERQTDPPRVVDHPMPGYRAAAWQGMQGVADLSGSTGKSRERRDITIGCDSAAGNAPHGGIDAGVAR
jgi:hypothetical protein